MSRPIWQGSITFGLVNIPVQLQTAVREKNVNFHLLSKDGSCRLRRKLYCPETGKEVDFSDTARGIEIGKDEYVLVDEKELERIRPEKGRSLSIEQFVQIDEIDPIYFDRPYFLTPADGSEKAYKLLHAAMKQSQRVGLARFVMRGRENLAAIRVMEDGLVLHTMHYADEVLALNDALPAALARAKEPGKEAAVAVQLIEAMTHPLNLSDFHDEYRQQVEVLIEQKRRGKQTVIPADDHDAESLPPTINLMDALRKSLAANKPAKGRSRAQHRGATHRRGDIAA